MRSFARLLALTLLLLPLAAEAAVGPSSLEQLRRQVAARLGEMPKRVQKYIVRELARFYPGTDRKADALLRATFAAVPPSETVAIPSELPGDRPHTHSFFGSAPVELAVGYEKARPFEKWWKWRPTEQRIRFRKGGETLLIEFDTHRKRTTVTLETRNEIVTRRWNRAGSLERLSIAQRKKPKDILLTSATGKKIPASKWLLEQMDRALEQLGHYTKPHTALAQQEATPASGSM